MSDTFIRHLIAIIGVLIGLIIYLAAYISGSHGWWWTAISVAIIYLIVYKLVDV